MIAHNEQTIALFKQNIVFADLSVEEINQIFKIVDRRTYKKNEIVFAIDQKAQSFFLIESGSFQLTLRNQDAKVLQKGFIFGEIGILNDSLRTGSIRALETASVFSICKQRLLNLVEPAVALKLILAIAKNVTNYLRFRELTSTRELIEEGENEFIEFKSSLRWNIHISKKDKAIEHASLKTIAAFLNSDGGTLLIGVKDDGSLLGLEADQFQNDDKMLLHLNKLIQDRIGILFTEFVTTDIELVKGQKVLRIDCEAATEPAYLTHNNEEHFYIRSGPGTLGLKVSQVFDYIYRRFN